MFNVCLLRRKYSGKPNITTTLRMPQSKGLQHKHPGGPELICFLRFKWYFNFKNLGISGRIKSFEGHIEALQVILKLCRSY